MEESTIWIIAIVAILGGALIGYLIGRNGGGSQKQTSLVDQLDETKREFAAYKQSVADHFDETSRLVGDLTESYKNVHHQLAKSSVALCGNDTLTKHVSEAITPALEESEDLTKVIEPITETGTESEAVEQPRDYAPKASDQEGTLSETFGLKEAKEETQEPVIPDAVEPNKRRAADQ